MVFLSKSKQKRNNRNGHRIKLNNPSTSRTMIAMLPNVGVNTHDTKNWPVALQSWLEASPTVMAMSPEGKFHECMLP